jgi:ArsR family transcriptional regulator, virulence genes transcriptional regulator
MHLDLMKNSPQMNNHELALFKLNSLKASSLLKKLSHPDRLLILCHLSMGELSAGELAKKSELGLSAFSQHLGILRNANLIQSRRVAQTIFYSIKDDSTLLILNTLKQIFCPDDTF